MRFWFGMGAAMAGVFAIGVLLGWWMRGKLISMMEEMPDIWPGERS